jgi:5-methylcytosine-specific restriction endonuclease McrA
MPKPLGNNLYRCEGPCARSLPIGWFPKAGTGWDGRPKRAARCRDCLRDKRLNDRSRRRLREKNARVGCIRVTESDLREILERQRFLCACGCGGSVLWELHWDHIVPLSKGGKHEKGNLRALTPRCNLRLGASMRF